MSNPRIASMRNGGGYNHNCALRSGFAIAAAILAFLPVCARAVKVPAVISAVKYATVYSSSGSERALTSGPLANLFDGDFAGEGVRMNEAGAYIVLDFSTFIQTSGNSVYVSEVAIGHSGNSTYSLYTSEDGSTWTTIASGATTSGTASYTIAANAPFVKYVFDTAADRSDSLCELQVKGYETSVPVNVAYLATNYGYAKMYKADGTLCGDGTGGFGGGSGLSWFFNGYKDTSDNPGWTRGGTYLPNLANGGWCQLDFSSVAPDGYFITKVSVSQCNDFKYSFYISMDGETWTAVDGAVQVSKVGEGIYNVNETATQVRVVFDETGGWTRNIAEIEVWAMDPEDVACTHPSFTDWTYVAGTASCLVPGTDERFCTVCGMRFTKEQVEPLGHDFVSHLGRSGSVARFGTGYISCSRCDWELQFPRPLDLLTNEVDGTRIGRVPVPGQVNFTELTVSSTGNGADDDSNWGVNPVALYDENWTFSWQKYWYSKTLNKDPSPHVDYEFGIPIDLCWVDISLRNANRQTVFYSVDDDTGEETEIGRISVEKNDELGGDDGVVTQARFYSTTVKHLRLREFDMEGNAIQMQISEIHPYGTVAGAGDVRVEKTTIFIIK